MAWIFGPSLCGSFVTGKRPAGGCKGVDVERRRLVHGRSDGAGLALDSVTGESWWIGGWISGWMGLLGGISRVL